MSEPTKTETPEVAKAAVTPVEKPFEQVTGEVGTAHPENKPPHIPTSGSAPVAKESEFKKIEGEVEDEFKKVEAAAKKDLTEFDAKLSSIFHKGSGVK